MFAVDDYVVFGSSGICRVTGCGPLEISGENSGRLYYTLTPCFEKRSVIYAPVDNKKGNLRAALKADEALALIDGIDSASLLDIHEERTREQAYRLALKTGNPNELIAVLKTIYARGESRSRKGRSLTSMDSRFFTQAEDLLYGELAVVLGIEKEKVPEFIHERKNRQTVGCE